MWNIFSSSLAAAAPLLCALATLVMGFGLAAFYIKSGQHSQTMAVTLVVIPVLIQVVIMLVNGNIGTSVAAMGAFSLVRFRSLPGSARELVFVLFAMAVGLMNGLGFLLLSLALIPALGLVLMVLGRLGFGEAASGVRWLKMTVPEQLNDTDAFDSILANYTRSSCLESIRTTSMGTLFELTFMLELKRHVNEISLINELRCRNGNLSILLEKRPADRQVL